jgi:hypothetical protein
LPAGTGLAAGGPDEPVPAGLSAAELAGPVLSGPVLSGPVLSGPVLSGLVLSGGVVAGGVVAGGVVVGAALAGGGVVGAVLAGGGVAELGLGLAAGLTQGVDRGLAALALAGVGLAGLGVGLAGAWLAAGGLVGVVLVAGGLVGVVLVAGGLVGVVLVAGGLLGVVLAAGGRAGVVVTGGVLAWLLGLAGGTAKADAPDVQLVVGCTVPWPPCVAPVPPAPAAPLPGPLAPGSPVPAGSGSPPPMEFRALSACEIMCRPNGVTAETLMASRTVTAATVATRRSRPVYRPSAAPPRRWTSPGTVCSQAKTESRLPRVRLATREHTAISQATGSGCGGVSRARIRSRPSSAGSIGSTAVCSAPRRKSSKSPWCWLMPHRPAPRAGPSWPWPRGS